MIAKSTLKTQHTQPPSTCQHPWHLRIQVIQSHSYKSLAFVRQVPCGGFFPDKYNPEELHSNLFLILKLQLLLPCNSQPFDSDTRKFLILHHEYKNGHIIKKSPKFLKKISVCALT